MTHVRAADVRLQPATTDNPELAAELIYETDPHIFGYMHGYDRALARRHLGRQWQQPAGLFSHKHATVAVHEGCMVGLLIGFAQSVRMAAVEPFLQCALASMNDEELEYMTNWRALGGPFLIPAVPPDGYYLQNLATIPEARGRGIGEQLLRHAFELAGAADCRSVHLDLFADNPAIRLYRRFGMEVMVETRVPPLAARGVPAHYRMIKML